jgi:hypothetical protein
MLAWNEDGDGMVIQVTTPSWPAAGSKRFPRKTDGNTLGCVLDDNVKVSQHFFALRLTHGDVVMVLKALTNASVVTDPANSQVVNNGGPADIKQLVESLGAKTHGKTYTIDTLSSQVQLISKPSNLHVPPWQMVSVALGRVSLRVATWWEENKDTAIPSTTAETPMGCWVDSMPKPGAVEIAKSGQWGGKSFGLRGGNGPDFNHAKIGVSTDGAHHYSIFGDMNQEGDVSGEHCTSSQNSRGGLFFVIDNGPLHAAVTDLIRGDTADTE